MENSFKLLLNENLFLSFLKRKIKIFKNSKNFNCNSNFPLLHGHGYLKSSDNMNILMTTYQHLPIENKKFKTDSKAKKFQFNVLKIVYATDKTLKTMNNFVIIVWLMYGKVNVQIVEQEFNVATVILRNKSYAEILKSKTKKEKLSKKIYKIKIVTLKNSWHGEWIYLRETLFSTVYLKLMF